MLSEATFRKDGVVVRDKDEGEGGGAQGGGATIFWATTVGGGLLDACDGCWTNIAGKSRCWSGVRGTIIALLRVRGREHRLNCKANIRSRSLDFPLFGFAVVAAAEFDDEFEQDGFSDLPRGEADILILIFLDSNWMKTRVPRGEKRREKAQKQTLNVVASRIYKRRNGGARWAPLTHTTRVSSAHQASGATSSQSSSTQPFFSLLQPKSTILRHIIKNIFNRNSNF